MMEEIKRLRALNLPLKPHHEKLVYELQRLQKLKPRERYVFDGNKMHVIRENDVDAVFDAVKLTSDIQAEQGTQTKNRRYLGSLDPITAAQFSKESGLKIGTKEFARYATGKLRSSDYRKFSA